MHSSAVAGARTCRLKRTHSTDHLPGAGSAPLVPPPRSDKPDPHRQGPRLDGDRQPGRFRAVRLAPAAVEICSEAFAAGRKNGYIVPDAGVRTTINEPRLGERS